jgi:hypothetical protein
MNESEMKSYFYKSSLKLILSSYRASLTDDILEDILITRANREKIKQISYTYSFLCFGPQPTFLFRVQTYLRPSKTFSRPWALFVSCRGTISTRNEKNKSGQALIKSGQ